MITLIVDSLSVCHAAKHAMKRYPLSKDEMRTEVIFVFLQKLLTLSRRFNTNKFVFAWDSHKSIRQKMYPEYKANRKKSHTPDETFFNRLAFDQFSALRKTILPEMGFSNNFIQTGYEADDIVASIVKKYTIHNLVIISTDTDLHQLIGPTVSQFNHVSKKRFFLSDFQKKWDIDPKDWSRVKALAGCLSDNIEGIKGVGEKTAVKFIKGELGEKTKAYKSIIDKMHTIYERNKPLVSLPLKGSVSFTIEPDTLHISKFMSVFKRFDFRSFLKKEKIRDWMENFKL